MCINQICYSLKGPSLWFLELGILQRRKKHLKDHREDVLHSEISLVLVLMVSKYSTMLGLSF